MPYHMDKTTNGNWLVGLINFWQTTTEDESMKRMYLLLLLYTLPANAQLFFVLPPVESLKPSEFRLDMGAVHGKYYIIGRDQNRTYAPDLKIHAQFAKRVGFGLKPLASPALNHCTTTSLPHWKITCLPVVTLSSPPGSTSCGAKTLAKRKGLLQGQNPQRRRPQRRWYR